MSNFASRVMEVVAPELDEIRDRFKTGTSTNPPDASNVADAIVPLLNSIQSELRQNCAILEGRNADDKKKSPKSWKDVPKWIWRGIKDQVYHMLDYNNDGDLAIDDIINSLQDAGGEALRLGIETAHLGYDVLHDFIYDCINQFKQDRMRYELQSLGTRVDSLLNQGKRDSAWLQQTFQFLREWREADEQFKDAVMNSLEQCCHITHQMLDDEGQKLEETSDKVDDLKVTIVGGFEDVERLIATISPTTTANNTLEILTRVKRMQSDVDLLRGLLQEATNYSCL